MAEKKEIQKVEKVEKGVVEDAIRRSESATNIVDYKPAANLAHNKKKESFTIEIDLPGVKKEDINVTIEGDYLIVTAERKFKKDLSEKDYHIMESVYGRYTRSFYLPEDIDRDSIEAKFENGRLTITFEKVANKKRREIAVK
ncbi:MAG: Hsp20/alpha crystallin family protein [Epsilonproteobacteria bacterium]|nr:Hsp20/alpha crystallin family protein [Campylobacterota bacterium]